MKIFKNIPGLACGLSEKPDGPMNLRAESSEEAENHAAIRERFLRTKNFKTADVVFARSVHGAKIKNIGAQDRGKSLEGFDCLLSNTRGIFLALTVADCVPVYLFDRSKKVWGLVHAGWRGVAAGIVPAALEQMKKNFQSRPEDILLATGPAIQKCHFEVKEDVLQKFQDYPECIARNQSVTLDLPGVIRAQAEQFGLSDNQVETSEICTFCQQNRYFSHRRDRVKPLQTMLAYIGFAN